MSDAREHVDLAIIGGGPAGLAAAIGAHEAGVRDILILERDYACLGGILNQCIHSGFGLHRFGEELTGPEYAERDIETVRKLGIPALLGTMVLDITPERVITAVNENGVHTIQAKAIILAMGCRERPRGALNIPGTRPAGIFTAGTAQKFVNIDGFMPGREVVILGSGDIGLIMARRMTLEGARVKAVAELMPFSGGLKRNIVQCLDDFGIPLLLSHTVTRIAGRERLEGVDITQVDEKRQPVPGTTRFVPCDALLLSVGLLPENELSRSAGVELSPVTGGAVAGESLQTSVPGIFACGNVLHVHDLVDFVSAESMLAGRHAARFISNGGAGGEAGAGGGMPVKAEGGVRYTVPFFINPANLEETVDIRFRVGAVFRDKYLSAYIGDDRIVHKKERILSPGEMETITLKKSDFASRPDAKSVRVAIEEN